ncbi:MAG: polysaccharide biosynthesis/export family protein [Candidatus Eisenbacteria bacterium]
MAQIRTGLLAVVLGAALCCVCGCAGTDGGGVVDVADYEQPVVDSTEYRLRTGDSVRIIFQTDRSLDYEAPVSPAGTIGVPSGGEVAAAGRTVEEVRRDIEVMMAELLLDPRASVVLDSVAEQPVYVLGEVKSPGAVSGRGTMSLSMALAEAGGPLSSGKLSSVMVVRTSGVPSAVAIKVDVSKFLSGRDLAQDLPLEPYDVVFVPKSVIGKVNEFVELFFTQIAPAQLFYLRGYDIANRKPLSLYQ